MMRAVAVQFALVGSSTALLTRSTPEDQSMSLLREQYLSTVRMGLLGGLNHAAYTDPNRGATTDPGVRNECLIKDWQSGATLDNCIMKWDANERMLRVDDLYKKVQEQGIP